jgi:hypothetical protein
MFEYILHDQTDDVEKSVAGIQASRGPVRADLWM